MSKNSLSLTLNGDIPLSEFAEAILHFSSLVKELTSEVGGAADVEWEIVRLESGSATAVIVGKSPDELVIEKIVRAYEIIGNAIQNNEPIPYAEHIAREARAITGVLNGKITSVEFRTEDFEAAIDRAVDFEEIPTKNFSFGTVTGTVQTLSKRGHVRFILYDILFDRAVNCFLDEKQQSLMLDAWDKKVRVAGHIYRDPKTGRPTDIRDVSYMDVIEGPTIDIASLAGIVPWQEGEEFPEESIRRLRDAE